MYSLIRVCAAVNRVSVGNPALCYEDILDLVQNACSRQSDVVFLPQLAFCSPSCGALFANPGLAETCQIYLDKLCAATRDFSGYLVVGLAAITGDSVEDVFAVISGGSVVNLLPSNNPPAPLAKEMASKGVQPITVYECDGLRFAIVSAPPQKLAMEVIRAAQQGVELVLLPSYSPIVAGFYSRFRAEMQMLSRTLGISIAFANGGICDTSHPYMYSGACGIYECGKELSFVGAGQENIMVVNDIDMDIIRAAKQMTYQGEPLYSASPQRGKRGLLRPISPDPYLSGDEATDRLYLEELFDLQVKSLICRIQNTNINKLVVGISGGLDSTLALLVCDEALKRLELSPANLIGITMPGFGTTDRTYFNALSLLELLEATNKDIPIREAVTHHFADIAHSIANRDVTYENAQARERTQILLDIANKEHGMVVGTGDLSEAALGWSTFGGDHLANYNVNIDLTKTMVRQVLALLAKHYYSEEVGQILLDILDTPVSPELLPPDQEGEIVQKTEHLLGPYPLHDFFLYYLVKYNFRPEKLYYYACLAFATQFSPDFIMEKLKLFINRLFGGQFKRSCSPDSAIISEVTLNSAQYYIPSDCSPQLLLDQLDNIRF